MNKTLDKIRKQICMINLNPADEMRETKSLMTRLREAYDDANKHTPIFFLIANGKLLSLIS